MQSQRYGTKVACHGLGVEDCIATSAAMGTTQNENVVGLFGLVVCLLVVMPGFHVLKVACLFGFPGFISSPGLPVGTAP